MNLFVSEIVTPAAHLPITATDEALARAVTEEIERTVLWRAVVSQGRRILVNGPLPPYFEIEPLRGLTSITRWTETNAAEVIPAATYSHISSDPLGTTIFANPGKNWPVPLRPFGSFAINYSAGWTVTPETAPLANDAVNEVPPSIQLLLKRAIEFRAGSGVGDMPSARSRSASRTPTKPTESPPP